MPTTIPSPRKVGMVSLGCPKALVDSERILTRLRADGYAMSPDYAGADVVLVNTCGFLDSAKEESLAAIGEAIAEAGGSIENVIRTRLMLTDISRWRDAARAHGEVFRGVRPACTFVQVSGFIDPAWLVAASEVGVRGIFGD